jgi:hypothetical protein
MGVVPKVEVRRCGVTGCSLLAKGSLEKKGYRGETQWRWALEALTPRERAIFNAGMAAGAAQQLAQTATQHALFINASREQAQKRSAQALTLLEKAQPATEPSSATQAGAEAARRLVAAGKAILGR